MRRWAARSARGRGVGHGGGRARKSAILRAVDAGAHAAFVQGGVADAYVKDKRIEELAKALELIRRNRILAGIGAHMIEVPIALTKQGVDVGFRVKAFNEKKHWSAGPMPRLDSVFEETPEKTAEVSSDPRPGRRRALQEHRRRHERKTHLRRADRPETAGLGHGHA